MNPKEKAAELVEKYIYHVRVADGGNYHSNQKHVFIAKQCSIIAVRELMEDASMIDADLYIYWNEVKTEIEKL